MLAPYDVTLLTECNIMYNSNVLTLANVQKFKFRIHKPARTSFKHFQCLLSNILFEIHMFSLLKGTGTNVKNANKMRFSVINRILHSCSSIIELIKQVQENQ